MTTSVTPRERITRTLSQSDGRLDMFLLAVFLIVELIPGLHFKLSFSNDNIFNQLTFVTLYIFAAIRLFEMREQAIRLAMTSLPLIAFLAFMWVTALWSVDTNRTVTSCIELVGSTLIGYYLVLRFSASKLVNILLIKYFIFALTSYALIFLSPGRGRDDWGSGPWSGLSNEKNALGATMAIALISLLVFSPKNKRQRLVQIVAAVVFGVLLLGSQSATAFSACVVTIAVGTVIRIARLKSLPIAVRGIVVATGPVLVIFAILTNFTLSSLLELLGRSSSLTGRTDFWPYLQQAIADRPFLGFGYDAFFGSPVGNNYLGPFIVQAGGWSPFHAHNSFYQIALDGGYIAVGIFALLLGQGLFRAVRYCSAMSGASGTWPISILVFLICSSFTETAFAMFNTDDWIFFVAAILYPLIAEPSGAADVALQRAPFIHSKSRQRLAK